MTQDEIIRMAREAGFEVNYYKSLESEEVVSFDPIITYNLERFAALVATHEREACAKESLEVLENLRKETIVQCQQGMVEAYKLGQSEEREACAKVCEDDMGWLDNGGGELCAKAIRAREE